MGDELFIQQNVNEAVMEIIQSNEDIVRRIAAIDPQSALVALRLSLQEKFDYIIKMHRPIFTNQLIEEIEQSFIRCLQDSSFIVDRICSKTNMGGAGIRLIKERYSVINAYNSFIPNVGEYFPLLKDTIGDFSNKEERWKLFFKSNLGRGREFYGEIRGVHLRYQQITASVQQGFDVTQLSTIQRKLWNLDFII